MKTIIAATILAIAAGGATTADAQVFTTVGSAGLSDSGYCDSTTSSNLFYCGQTVGSTNEYWMVSDAFTLSTSETINDFMYYVKFDSGTAADYVSTNWAIYANKTSASPPAPNTALMLAGSTETIGSIDLDSALQVAGFTLISVPIPSMTLSAGTYWLGFQSNLQPDGSYTDYAATNPGPKSAYLGLYNQSNQDYSGLVPIYGQAAFSLYDFVSENPFPPFAAPEPSTWAMTLIGFLGLGFVARRRLARPRAA